MTHRADVAPDPVPEPDDAPDATGPGSDADRRRQLRRRVLVLIGVGVVVQLAVSAYYLSMAHAPRPHDLPVGFVATDAQAADVEKSIEEGGRFAAERYDGVPALEEAIRSKEIYGGVDVAAEQPELYVAGAAGLSAANTLRSAFTSVIEDETAQRVADATAAGKPVPPETVKALTAPPQVTDVVPLPDEDSSGTSLPWLVQALVIGTSVASMGLGRIGPMTRRSVSRGFGHVALLVVYAAASAAAVLLAARGFGVIPDGTAGRTFLMFFLLSLAVTASVSGLVALVGAPGTALGTIYFVFAIVISGSSVLPEFLPTAGRVLGQALPPGAGATAIRDSLYFPDAPVAGPVSVLAAYAVVGLGLVLVTNVVANRTPRTSLFGGDD